MSGGVDSTVAAALLQEQGFSVHGFFMLLPLPGLKKQISRVRSVARRMQIPLHLVDLRERFSTTIIHHFVDSYRQGLTPNPCVICNQMTKCGLLMEEMTALGMDKTATGHYARIDDRNGRAILRRAVDPGKDQSYFLCRLSAEQLDRLILPLGNWKKAAVYERARAMGFAEFDGQESQDVCFLANRELSAFLAEQGLPGTAGNIITGDGRVLGTHRGIWQYTVGQRRGLGIPDATPWYVIGLDARTNQVIIDKKDRLFHRDVRLRDVRWSVPIPELWQAKVQIRSRHRAAEAEIRLLEKDQALVHFVEPQRAITPGQFAVFYREEQVSGSGIIVSHC
jgi:tRNA-specific 2-thiouridylase